jgi:pyrimidine deaminase RibD-like protein
MEKIRPICKECADKLGLKPMIEDGFITGEPCEDCGSFSPTCFTDFMVNKIKQN